MSQTQPKTSLVETTQLCILQNDFSVVCGLHLKFWSIVICEGKEMTELSFRCRLGGLGCMYTRNQAVYQIRAVQTKRRGYVSIGFETDDFEI